MNGGMQGVESWGSTGRVGVGGGDVGVLRVSGACRSSECSDGV